MYVTVTIVRDALDLEKTLDEYNKHPKVQFTAFCAFFEFLIMKAKLFLKMLLTATKVPNVHFTDPKGRKFLFLKKKRIFF